MKINMHKNTVFFFPVFFLNQIFYCVIKVIQQHSFNIFHRFYSTFSSLVYFFVCMLLFYANVFLCVQAAHN